MIDIKALNASLDPMAVLGEIAYEHSSPNRSGRWIRDFCVMCQEHPGKDKAIGALSIDAERKCFICHKCSERGDLLHLMRKALNLNFPQTLERAKHIASTEIPTSGVNGVFSSRNNSEYRSEKRINRAIGEKYNSYKEDPKAIAEHPYFLVKLSDEDQGIAPNPPEGLRILAFTDRDGKDVNLLVVPFRDVEGHLLTLQYISTDGTKRFARGLSSKGGFFLIGEIADRVYVVEGLATGITVWESLRGKGPDHPEEKNSVAVAGGCNNVAHVTNAITKKYPHTSITLVLDQDVTGDKRDSLFERIESSERTRFITPPLSEEGDFNDIAKRGYGREEIAKQLRDSLPLSKGNYYQSFKTQGEES